MKKKTIVPFFQENYSGDTKLYYFNEFESADDAHKRLMYFKDHIIPIKSTVSIKVDGYRLSYCHYETFYRYGINGFYKKRNFITTIVIDREKEKIIANWHNINIAELMNILDFKFLMKIPRCMLSKGVLEKVFLGKITSQEGAVKAYLASIKCRDFPYRAALEYCRNNYDRERALYRLKDIIVNPIDYLNHFEEYKIDFDLISQALILGRKINHRWSKKRMEETHTQWSREIMRYCIEDKDNTPIWDERLVKLIELHGAKLLNTELEVFEEGYTMEHCLYTNYWSIIKSKKYIALSYKVNGDNVTIGIHNDGSLDYQQAYKKRNTSLTESETSEIENLIANIRHILKEMRNIYKEENVTAYVQDY